MASFEGHGLAYIRSDRIVFAELDFSVSAGEALLLTGANGSGKSSLLRLMAGLGRPAAGRLLWNGVPVDDDRDVFFRETHYLGHRDAVKPALTVRENLAFHAALRGAGDGDALDAALSAVGLDALAGMPARMLSAGQTRRLALARVLASPAALWLLDEPTIALDATSVSAIFAAIARHRAAGGMVVASTNVPLALETPKRLDLSEFHDAGVTPWGDAA